MTALALVNPIGQFFDLDGSPLQGGSMYFGTVNLNPITAPVTVYWDAAATQPASQPVRTLNGYPVRNGTAAAVYAVGNVSMLVLNGAGQQVLYARSSADIGGAASVQIALDAFAADLASTTDVVKGPGLIGYDSLLDHGSGKTVGAALSGAGRILQGADPTGSVDATALFKALADKCIPLGEKQIWPAGTYKVSGPITSSSYPAGSLHIHCAGDVTIEVDPASTAFSRLIQCETTAAGNVTVTGGRLTLNCNNKAGSGLYCRHYGSGGSVVIDNVRVTDAKHDTAAVVENGGVYLSGRWDSGKIGAIEVDGVDRAGGGTAARGVLIADIQGPFTAESIKVANVLSTGYTVDADGVFLSGYTSGASTTQRAGSFTIGRLEASDCQGRSLKAQHQDVSIRDCITRRQFVVSFDVLDIDFQLGGGNIDTLQLNYFKNGATSPLHANFYPLAAQQLCTDRACVTRIGNVVLRTEVQVQRLVQVVVGATALDSATYINGVEAVPYNGLTGSIFQRCAVEFDATQVAASSNKTHISIRNIRGNVTNVPLVGHTGYTTGVTNVSTKLSIDALDNENTGTYDTNNRIIYPISGNEITSMSRLMCRDNTGFGDLMAPGWVMDFATLPVGLRCNINLATAVVSNGPVNLPASGYALVECIGSISSATADRNIRITVDNGVAEAPGDKCFYTGTGTWGAIK